MPIPKTFMKKFCSECGNKLSPARKLCDSCGAVNPYYSPIYSEAGYYGDVPEKPLLGKERFEMEMLEKEHQAELLRRERLRRELEEIEQQKRERLEKVRVIKERFEREETNQQLQKEIQQVKQETEQYKKETNELLLKLRNELQQIEEENKRLKAEFEQLNRILIEEQPTAETVVEPSAPIEVKKAKPVVPLALGTLSLVLLVVLMYFAYGFVLRVGTMAGVQNKQQQLSTPAVENNGETPIAQTLTIEPNTTDTLPAVDASITENETTEATTENASANGEVVNAITPFTLSGEKIKTDLAGMVVSGCDITVKSPNEIVLVKDIVKVGAITSGYIKYRATINILQDGYTYKTTPYLYYRANGTFIKIDAANCE